MLKKLLLSTVVAGLSTVAMAHDQKAAFHGFNAGLGLGYASGQAKLERTYSVSPTNARDMANIGTTGAIGGLTLGYGMNYKGLFYGVEAGAFLSGIDGKNDYSNNDDMDVRLKLKMKSSYQLALKVGKSICNTVLPYVKIGTALSKWELETKDYAPDIESANTSKHKWAFIAGFGTDFIIAKQLSMGVDYQWSRYQKLSHNHEGSANMSVKPRLHTVMVNLRWYLGK